MDNRIETAPALPRPAVCPFTPGKPMDEDMETVSIASGRDLAPCHKWLAKDWVRPEVPSMSADAWAGARHVDVAVVGGGMGGLNTAWRLQGCDGSAPPAGSSKAPSVAIFERTHHLGGRVHSLQVEGAQIPVDLGAMRFIPSQHVLLNGLAQHFNIATRDFVVGGDKNLQYFRGTRLTNEEVAKNPSLLPFNLAPAEKGKSADELLAMAIEAVVPGFRQLSPDAWEKAKRSTMVSVLDPTTRTPASVPLSQLGLQNVLARTLSHEAMALVTDSVGYQSFCQNWDAGQALEGIAGDFKPGTAYKVPVDGMGAFPRALVADLKKAGTDIERETTLRRVEYDADQKQFHLTFQDGKGKPLAVVADKVVLNLPRTPLEELVNASPFLQHQDLDRYTSKVTANPMTRIYATFDKPWWNDMGIQAGRSLTDLELGQVYYYGQPGDKRPYLEVYADGTNSQYWEGLQNPGDPGVSKMLCAKPQLAQQLTQELAELHGRDIPTPTGLVYKRWADEFFGGAYHTWNAGSRPFDTSAAMIAPLGALPLYVCGEAYSTTQGWIEGSLQTSEKVLGKLGKVPLG